MLTMAQASDIKKQRQLKQGRFFFFLLVQVTGLLYDGNKFYKDSKCLNVQSLLFYSHTALSGYIIIRQTFIISPGLNISLLIVSISDRQVTALRCGFWVSYCSSCVIKSQYGKPDFFKVLATTKTPQA